MDVPKISIVVPTYNAEQFIVQALSSVFKTRYKNYEVVVVDDMSKDRTIKLIKKNFKQKNLVVSVNQTKRLAAGSRNRGVELATGEYIALLDHDIEVDPNWLKEMLKVFAKNKKIGVVQSRVLDLKNRYIIQHAGISIQSFLGWVIPIGMGDDARKTHLVEKEVFANATGLMFKKKVWEKIGGFDEYLAINTDDWDFNWRCWLYGYKQVLAPKAITYHWSKEQKTRDAWISRAKWEFNFAKVPWLFIKNYELKNIIWFLPVYLSVNFFRGVVNLLFRFNAAPLVAWFLSISWVLRNFAVLLKKRHEVQSHRKIADQYLIDNLMDSQFIHHYFLDHWLKVFKIGNSISTKNPYE